MKPFVFLDAETTGFAKNDLIELGLLTEDMEEPWVIRCKPVFPIELGAMAKNHITPAMLINEPRFLEHPDYERIRSLIESHTVVAHNAKYDVDVLEKQGIHILKSDTVDTKRLALKLYPDLEEHSLQYLRYALDANVVGAVPHSAGGDVLVLRALFNKLVRKVMQDQKMIRSEAHDVLQELCDTPTILHRVPKRFKKHADVPFVEVNRIDRAYIEWMHREIPSMDDVDLVHTVQYYYRRRTG